MKKDKQYWHDFIRDMPAAEFRDLFWEAVEWQARLINLYEGMTRKGMKFESIDDHKEDIDAIIKREKLPLWKR